MQTFYKIAEEYPKVFRFNINKFQANQHPNEATLSANVTSSISSHVKDFKLNRNHSSLAKSLPFNVVYSCSLLVYSLYLTWLE